MKKNIGILLAVTLSLSIAGCSLPTLPPKDADSLIARCAKNDTSSYKLLVDYDMSVSVSGEGTSIEVPVDMSIDSTVVDNCAHGTMDISTEVLGTKVKNDLDFYVDNDAIYISSEDDKYSTIKVGEPIFTAQSLIPLSDDSTIFNHDKDSKTYTLTTDIDADSGYFSQLIDNSNFDFSALASDIDIQDVLKSIEGGKVVYTIDNKFNVNHITVSGVTFDCTTESLGDDVSIKLGMDIDFKISDYNNFNIEDVTVPTDIKENAEPYEESDVSDFGFSDDSSDTSDSGESAEESTVIITDDMEDSLGAYNGVAFSDSNTSWDSTFGSDGWDFDTDNDTGSSHSVYLKNSKYDPDIYIRLSNKGFTDVTADEICKDGFSGYTVDIAGCESDNLPPMTWRGVTLHSDVEAIKAAYGEPESTYTSDDYTSLTYNVGNGELEFDFYSDLGLIEVSYYTFD